MKLCLTSPAGARDRMLLGPGCVGMMHDGTEPFTWWVLQSKSISRLSALSVLPVPSLQVAFVPGCGTFPAFGEEPVAISTEPEKGAPKNPLFHIRFLSMCNVSSKPRHCSGPVSVILPLPARTSLCGGPGCEDTREQQRCYPGVGQTEELLPQHCRISPCSPTMAARCREEAGGRVTRQRIQSHVFKKF